MSGFPNLLSGISLDGEKALNSLRRARSFSGSLRASSPCTQMSSHKNMFSEVPPESEAILDCTGTMLDTLVQCIEELQAHVSFLLTHIQPMEVCERTPKKTSNAKSGPYRAVGCKARSLCQQALEIKRLKAAIREIRSQHCATEKKVRRVAAKCNKKHRLCVHSKRGTANEQAFKHAHIFPGVSLDIESMSQIGYKRTSHRTTQTSTSAHSEDLESLVSDSNVDLQMNWNFNDVIPADQTPPQREMVLEAPAPPDGACTENQLRGASTVARHVQTQVPRESINTAPVTARAYYAYEPALSKENTGAFFDLSEIPSEWPELPVCMLPSMECSPGKTF